HRIAFVLSAALAGCAATPSPAVSAPVAPVAPTTGTQADSPLVPTAPSAPSPTPPPVQAATKAIDPAAVAGATGGKPEVLDKDVKVSFPRADLPVTVDGWKNVP